MKSIKVSIIIPVYNAADFLAECIQSVLDQTFQDIEIILINDGSIDYSLAILKDFEKTDSRIKVINQENKGVSAARNKGLEIACGEWIAFLDADDWMEPAMLETLYNSVISTKAGMAVCNVNQIQKDNTAILRINLKEGLFDFKGKPENAVEAMMDFKYDYANWNKLYDRNLIEKYQISFNENICIGEDLLFNLNYLHFIDKIVCTAIPLYNYRLHEYSTMARSSNKRITQYDLQFKAYKSFIEKKRMSKEWDVFRRIMARGFYNVLLPVIIRNIKIDKNKRISSVRILVEIIKNLDSDLFYYPEKGIGIQAYKKRLLEKKKFLQFSRIVGLKNF